ERRQRGFGRVHVVDDVLQAPDIAVVRRAEESPSQGADHQSLEVVAGGVRSPTDEIGGSAQPVNSRGHDPCGPAPLASSPGDMLYGRASVPAGETGGAPSDQKDSRVCRFAPPFPLLWSRRSPPPRPSPPRPKRRMRPPPPRRRPARRPMIPWWRGSMAPRSAARR